MDERVIEIRTYRLIAGERAAFHRVVVEQALPLLESFAMEVVRAGPSEADEDGVEEYVLIRAFDSHADRDAQEQRFYGSREWCDGPRTGIVSRIESYHTIVLTVPSEVVQGLRWVFVGLGRPLIGESVSPGCRRRSRRCRRRRCRRGGRRSSPVRPPAR